MFVDQSENINFVKIFFVANSLDEFEDFFYVFVSFFHFFFVNSSECSFDKLSLDIFSFSVSQAQKTKRKRIKNKRNSKNKKKTRKKKQESQSFNDKELISCKL